MIRYKQVSVCLVNETFSHEFEHATVTYSNGFISVRGYRPKDSEHHVKIVYPSTAVQFVVHRGVST